jgi:hypothetical protein
MARTATLVSAAILISAATLAAQQTAPAQPQGGQLTASDQIKATGCVAKNAQGAFTLTNAAIEVTPYIGPGGAPARGTPKPQESKTTFILQNGTNLDAHVGHKVTITGKVGPASATSADSVEVPAPPAPEGRGGRAGGARGGSQRMYVPRLEVQALTMVAPSCQ